MRHALTIFAVALCVWTCGGEAPPDAPPMGQFYFPTGIAHVPSSGGGAGTLYVASANFDKRYDFGTVSAIDLDALDWPAFGGGSLARPAYLDPGTPPPDGGVPDAGGPADAGDLPDAGDTSDAGEPTDAGTGGGGGATVELPVEITDLQVTEARRVLTQAYGGLMAVHDLGDGRHRLFLPSRAEEDQLFIIDADGPNLSCFGADAEARDCTLTAPSLTAQGASAPTEETEDGFRDGKPRAPEPYAAMIHRGKVYITHLQPADQPAQSSEKPESYLVELDANDPVISGPSFISIGRHPSVGLAATGDLLWVTGRVFGSESPPTLRRVNLASRGSVLEVRVQDQFRLFDARSVAISPPAEDGDPIRLYVVGRSPDVLLVLTAEDEGAGALSLTDSVLLPDGPNDVKVIPRGARRLPLVVVTATAGDSVAIYDEETGQIATVLVDVGVQPFAIAVDRVEGAPGARLYVTTFGDGRVAVIDIPDLDRPFEARVVAYLGAQQECVTDERGIPACEGATR